MRPSRPMGALVVVLGLAFGAAAAADDRELDRMVQGWLKRVATIDEMLRAENWEKAEKQCDGLLRDISRNLVARGSDLIGKILVQRAISLQAQGKRDDALWDVHVADSLSAHTRRFLGEHEARGADLLEELTEAADTTLQPAVLADSGWGLLVLPESPEISEERDASEIVYMPGGDVQAPEKRSGRNPEYSDALRYAHVEDYVIIQLTIDREGRPREPKTYKGGGHPVLLLRTFDTVKDWRFRPAERDGRPVDCYYFLTINFALL